MTTSRQHLFLATSISLILGIAASADAQMWGTSLRLNTSTANGSPGVTGGGPGTQQETGGAFVAGLTGTLDDSRAYVWASAQSTSALPVLKAYAAAKTTKSAGRAIASGLAAFRYAGSDGAQLTVSMTLTGDVYEPVPTRSQLSADLYLLTEDVPRYEVFSPNYRETATVLETTFISAGVTGSVSETRTLQTTLNDGDIFHVAMSLLAYAGWSPGYADATSTLTGTVEVSTGRVVPIPEPSSIVYFSLGASGLGWTNYRRLKLRRSSARMPRGSILCDLLGPSFTEK